MSFPLDAWANFQSWPAGAKLLMASADLQQLEEFPTPEEWQALASRRVDFANLALRFSLEEKPGQRARRKIPKRSLRSYEQWIFERGEIPTRAHNFHDFFNALIWMNFPRGKFALHRRAFKVQQEWANDPAFVEGKRSTLADRLTCFDEGGVVFELGAAEDRSEVETILQSRDDKLKEEFVKSNSARFTLFGHGILEVLMLRLLSPNEPQRLNASCLILNYDQRSQDERLCEYLDGFGNDTPDHGTLQVGWL